MNVNAWVFSARSTVQRTSRCVAFLTHAINNCALLLSLFSERAFRDEFFGLLDRKCVEMVVLRIESIGRADVNFVDVALKAAGEILFLS